MKQERITALQKVFEQLKKDGKIFTQSDLAKQTGFAEVPMSQMLRGKKPIPIRLLESLHDNFNINVNYLVSKGKGPIYLDDESDLEAKVSVLEKEMEAIKKQLEDKNKIITLMESLNSVQKETN